MTSSIPASMTAPRPRSEIVDLVVHSFAPCTFLTEADNDGLTHHGHLLFPSGRAELQEHMNSQQQLAVIEETIGASRDRHIKLEKLYRDHDVDVDVNDDNFDSFSDAPSNLSSFSTTSSTARSRRKNATPCQQVVLRIEEVQREFLHCVAEKEWAGASTSTSPRTSSSSTSAAGLTGVEFLTLLKKQLHIPSWEDARLLELAEVFQLAVSPGNSTLSWQEFMDFLVEHGGGGASGGAGGGGGRGGGGADRSNVSNLAGMVFTPIRQPEQVGGAPLAHHRCDQFFDLQYSSHSQLLFYRDKKERSLLHFVTCPDLKDGDNHVVSAKIDTNNSRGRGSFNVRTTTNTLSQVTVTSVNRIETEAEKKDIKRSIDIGGGAGNNGNDVGSAGTKNILSSNSLILAYEIFVMEKKQYIAVSCADCTVLFFDGASLKQLRPMINLGGGTSSGVVHGTRANVHAVAKTRTGGTGNVGSGPPTTSGVMNPARRNTQFHQLQGGAPLHQSPALSPGGAAFGSFANSFTATPTHLAAGAGQAGPGPAVARTRNPAVFLRFSSSASNSGCQLFAADRTGVIASYDIARVLLDLDYRSDAEPLYRMRHQDAVARSISAASSEQFVSTEQPLSSDKKILNGLIELTHLNQLASYSFDGNIVLWENGSLKRVMRKGHRLGVSCMIYCESVKKMVSGGFDNQLLVWNPFAGTSRAFETSRHGSAIVGLCPVWNSSSSCAGASSSSGSTSTSATVFVSVDQSGVCKAWDLVQFCCLQKTWNLSARPGSNVVCMHDFSRIVVASGCEFLPYKYSQRTNIGNNTHDTDLSAIVRVQYCRGRIYSAAGNRLRVWNSECGVLEKEMLLPQWSSSSAPHPHSGSAGPRPGGGSSAAGQHQAEDALVTDFCLDPFGRKLYLGDHFGRIGCYNAVTLVFLKWLHPHKFNTEVTQLYYCNHGGVGGVAAAASSSSSTMKMNPPPAAAAQQQQQQQQQVSQILSVGWDRCLQVHEELPDSTTSVNRRVTNAHDADITCVTHSNLLSCIATGSSDKVICLRDFAKLRVLGTLLGQPGTVTSLVFVDYLLISGDSEGNVLVWRLDSLPTAGAGGDVDPRSQKSELSEHALVSRFLNIRSAMNIPHPISGLAAYCEKGDADAPAPASPTSTTVSLQLFVGDETGVLRCWDLSRLATIDRALFVDHQASPAGAVEGGRGGSRITGPSSCSSSAQKQNVAAGAYTSANAPASDGAAGGSAEIDGSLASKIAVAQAAEFRRKVLRDSDRFAAVAELLGETSAASTHNGGPLLASDATKSNAIASIQLISATNCDGATTQQIHSTRQQFLSRGDVSNGSLLVCNSLNKLSEDEEEDETTFDELVLLTAGPTGRGVVWTSGLNYTCHLRSDGKNINEWTFPDCQSHDGAELVELARKTAERETKAKQERSCTRVKNMLGIAAGLGGGAGNVVRANNNHRRDGRGVY